MNQFGYNIYIHGNNTRNHPVYLSSSQTSKKHYVFLFIVNVFFFKKLEKKRSEQVLPRDREKGRREMDQ
jgi:hypothetical protein